MIIRNYASASIGMFTTADNCPRTMDHGPRPTGCQPSTAYLIDPQTLFSLVCGGKGELIFEIFIEPE